MATTKPDQRRWLTVAGASATVTVKSTVLLLAALAAVATGVDWTARIGIGLIAFVRRTNFHNAIDVEALLIVFVCLGGSVKLCSWGARELRRRLRWR